MHKSKSHSFVIFPSSVRSIPFTVPVLPSSSSSIHCRLEDSDASIHSTSLCSSVSRSTHRAPSPFFSSASVLRRDATIAGSEHPPPPPSALTEERTGGERWASEPCCLEGSPLQSKRSIVGGNNNNYSAFRQKNLRFSCDSIASQRTIDLESKS